MKKFIKATLACALTLGFMSCHDDDGSTTLPDNTITGDLLVELTGLTELGNDFVYEGWIIVDGNPVSTGTFSSVEFPQNFSVDTQNLIDATDFILTIEPAVDTDPGPSDKKLLSGTFASSIGNIAAVNSNIIADFRDAEAKYLVGETSRDSTAMDDDGNTEIITLIEGKNALWYVGDVGGTTITTDPDTGVTTTTINEPIAGLDLPELSAEWIYEGWVVIDGTPVSTGTFTNGNGPDSNATPSDLFSFPGQDLSTGTINGVTFPTDLNGKTIVISVEPVPDNDPAPFALKPYSATLDVNDEEVVNTVQEMSSEIFTGIVRKQ